MLGIKTLYVSADAFKFLQEPNFENFNILSRGAAHIASLSMGANIYSLSFNSADIAAQIYYGEYAQASIQAATTVGYSLFSILPDILGVPLAPVYQAFSISYISQQATNIFKKLI